MSKQSSIFFQSSTTPIKECEIQTWIRKLSSTACLKKKKRKHFLWLWIEWSVIPSAPRSSFIVWHPWRQKMVMGLLVLAPSAISWRTVLCCAIIAVFFISNDSDKKCLCPQTKLSESGLLACYLTSDKVHTCGTAMNVCAKDCRSKILRLSILLYMFKTLYNLDL